MRVITPKGKMTSTGMLCTSISKPSPELRQHLCSQLRQAQGCIETIKACNSTGVAQPAEALIQKHAQDGLKNSTVRLKNFTEAGL